MQNPFSTAAVSPGKIGFVFANNITIETINDRLADLSWHAQIVGPHGTGKSTLVRNLIEQLASTHEVVELDPRELAGASELPVLRFSQQPSLIVIDGLEQLTQTLQRRMIEWTRDCSIGFLCTTHAAVDGLPVLWETRCSVELFQQLVRQLLSANDSQSLSPTDQESETIFRKHDGNMREALFEMYDWFENSK